MAKKDTKSKKKILNKIVFCKCGYEWDRNFVIAAQTIHTTTTYEYKFLGKYSMDSGGYPVLLTLSRCPNCRKINEK